MCICSTNTPLRGPLRGLANASPLDHEQEQGGLPSPSPAPLPWTTSVRVDQDYGEPSRSPRGPPSSTVSSVHPEERTLAPPR